jgi:hypothetical protein
MADQGKKQRKQEHKAVRKHQAARPTDREWAELRERPDPALLQRAVADPAGASPGDILNLQRGYGNRAVSGLIQAKLQVGAAGDQYEQEADRVAEKVTSIPALSKVKGPAPGSGEGAVQREIEAEEEELLQPKSLVQRRAVPGGAPTPAEGGIVDRDVERRIASSRGSGQSLPDELRTDMEARFGASFVGVRVHADGQAAELNRELGARAFTHGRDIYFREGEYDPGSSAGQRLLAHELTHVLQQTGAGTRHGPEPGSGEEPERLAGADAAGPRTLSGASRSPAAHGQALVTPGPAVVQRQVWKDLGYSSEQEWRTNVPEKMRNQQRRDWFEQQAQAKAPRERSGSLSLPSTKNPLVKTEEKGESGTGSKKERRKSMSLPSLPREKKKTVDESKIPKPPPMKKEFKLTEEQEGQFFERQKGLRETELREIGEKIKGGEGPEAAPKSEFEKELREKRGALKRRPPRRVISLGEEQENKFFERRREEREAELEQLRKDVKTGKTEVSEGVGMAVPSEEDVQSLKARGRKGKSSFEKELIKGRKKLSPRREVVPKAPALPEGKSKSGVKPEKKRSWLDRFRRRKKKEVTTGTVKGPEATKEPQDVGLKPRGFDPMEQKPPETKFLSTEAPKEEPKKEEAKPSGMESMMGGMMGGMMGAMMMGMMGKGISQGPDVGNLSGQVKELEARIKSLEDQLK